MPLSFQELSFLCLTKGGLGFQKHALPCLFYLDFAAFTSGPLTCEASTVSVLQAISPVLVLLKFLFIYWCILIILNKFCDISYMYVMHFGHIHASLSNKSPLTLSGFNQGSYQAWVYGYLHEHGQMTNGYLTGENVSPSPSNQ